MLRMVTIKNPGGRHPGYRQLNYFFFFRWPGWKTGTQIIQDSFGARHIHFCCPFQVGIKGQYGNIRFTSAQQHGIIQHINDRLCNLPDLANSFECIEVNIQLSCFNIRWCRSSGYPEVLCTFSDKRNRLVSHFG